MSNNPLYVPPKATVWLLAHPMATVPEAAAALHVAIKTVRTYRHRLIKAGLLDKHGMRAKLAATRDCIREGLHWREAARRLHVSPTAISWRLRRLGLSVDCVRRDQVYSGQEWAALFGYAPASAGSYQALRRWADAGLATNDPGPCQHWRVTAEALMAFLEDPRSWSVVKIKRIADPDWKQYAERARAGQFVQTVSRSRRKKAS